MLNNLSKLFLFICFLFVFTRQAVCAQNTTDYEAISAEQGLSQGMIFDMLQDNDGFLWLATKNGLNRYDGYSFKVFSNDPQNSKSLSSNIVNKLFEDSKGRLWVGTEDAGINIYDKKTGNFYRFSYQPENNNGLSSNAVKSIAELPDGRIVVALSGTGFDIIDLPKDFFEKQGTPQISNFILPAHADVYAMGTDKKGNMWIGGLDGKVYRFDPVKNTFIILNNAEFYNNGYLTKGNNVLINNSYFLADGKEIFPLFDEKKILTGNIIIKNMLGLSATTHQHADAYKASWWQPGKVPEWDVALPKTPGAVYPFLIDRSGIVWSGSIGYGLRKYNTARDKFKEHLLPGYSARWIKPTSDGRLYVGDFSLGWKEISDKQDLGNTFKKIKELNFLDNFLITRSGDYWMKTDDHGYMAYNPISGKLTMHPELDEFNIHNLLSEKQPMLEDSRGYIWMPSRNGRFARFSIITGAIQSFNINAQPEQVASPKASCTSIYEDAQGVFWIGTQDGFASLIFKDGNAQPQIKWYHSDANNLNSLNFNHVSGFLDDPVEPNRYLWICTKGGGLNRLDKISGNFFHLTKKEGLPDNVIYGILADHKGNIWGSTNNGIFCLLANSADNKDNWNFRNFTKAYGLQDNEFNTGAYVKLANGNLAFGGVNGINIFNPEEVLAGEFTPGIYITNVLINNKVVFPGDQTGVLQHTIEQTKSITLNHLQDILTLEFSSLDFTAPLQNKYRYQLIGIDKGWVESDNRRSATYLHLPPGKYTFKVQGSNSQGIWSENIARLQVTILPPWWLSWWAYGCYILLFILGIRAYLKFRLNGQKLKSQLEYEQVEARRVKELDTIKTQLYTNITHEFRTPLTVILGMANQVINKPEKHLKNGMEMIVRNGQHLLNLVNEMLDLSKLENGKLELQLTSGDIINFLRYIVESFHSLAESQQKQLHFLTEIDALTVAYDAEKIRQVITNLLSNALKFTPEKGNIYISVNQTGSPKKEGHVMLFIKVKDTGIGIPEDEIMNVFDRFYQLDNSLTRNAEGTGIGLTLTKELVKLMEGEITVKSPPIGANKGSEFSVSIPLLKTMEKDVPVAYPIHLPQKPAPAAPVVIPQITGAQKKDQPLVLFVEDNADVVAYTASCLQGYRLAVGKDGREGLEIARDLIPDLIITDVMMPFIDGFELVRQLRSDEHTSHIPIIMLTAKANIESRIEGLQQGVDAYLEKPFHQEELLVIIKKLLELRENLQSYYLKKVGLNDHSLKQTIIPNEIIDLKKIENSFVIKVREAVEKNLTDPNFTVDQLCSIVFMSHSQLHRKLDALTGYSPNKFIRIIRLNKAKELLQNSKNSIAAIAFECGFSDPGYFTRVFKQEYDVTPQKWRNSGE